MLNPRDLAPHVAGDGTGREVRDGVQPQVSDRHRLARCFGLEALGLKSTGGLGGCLVSQDGAQEILKGGARLVLIHGHRLAGGR